MMKSGFLNFTIVMKSFSAHFLNQANFENATM